jgi:Fe-S cluster assembly ATP-binding protein
MAEPILKITDLHAVIAEDGNEILRGVNLELAVGQIDAIMGPNGSGKSTLSKVLSGHPAYEVTEGEVLFRGENLLEMEVDERARAGLFLAFQYPVDIPGVSIANFLRTSLQSRKPGEEVDIFDFQEDLLEKMALLEMDPSFAERSVNEGFSGGEKKRNEILQMAMLNPLLAVMDETDSGLDIDALKVVSNGVNTLHQKSGEMSILLITHYQRLLDYIRPDHVHVMVDGRIVRSGGPELAQQLEAEGYAEFTESVGA